MTGRNSFMPLGKVWFSLRRFSRNSRLLDVFFVKGKNTCTEIHENLTNGLVVDIRSQVDCKRKYCVKKIWANGKIWHTQMTKWMHIKGVLLNVTWQFCSDQDAHNYSYKENMFVVKDYADLFCQSSIKSVLSLIRRQITTANTDNGNQKTNVTACYQGSWFIIIM